MNDFCQRHNTLGGRCTPTHPACTHVNREFDRGEYADCVTLATNVPHQVTRGGPLPTFSGHNRVYAVDPIEGCNLEGESEFRGRIGGIAKYGSNCAHALLLLKGTVHTVSSPRFVGTEDMIPQHTVTVTDTGKTPTPDISFMEKAMLVGLALYAEWKHLSR